MHARFQKQLSQNELVSYKPITTIQRLLADVIDKDRPNATTARPITRVRLAETLTQDRHNKNERKEKVRLKIKLFIDRH